MPEKPSNNGHVPQKPVIRPTGPSKGVRDEYIRRVKEIIRKKQQPPTKKGS